MLSYDMREELAAYGRRVEELRKAAERTGEPLAREAAEAADAAFAACVAGVAAAANGGEWGGLEAEGHFAREGEYLEKAAEAVAALEARTEAAARRRQVAEMAREAKIAALRDYLRSEPYSDARAFEALLTYIAADVEGGADAGKAEDAVRRAKRAWDFGDTASAVSILLRHIGGTVERPVVVGGGR